MRGARRFDPAQNSEACAMYRHLAQNINVRNLLQKIALDHVRLVRSQKKAEKKAVFCLCCNKINMDPGDDFEVLKPFSIFSGEI